MDWKRDGGDWPNRDASRFVPAGGLQWHVQVMGEGPAVLLAHGTGASSHSWRDLAPRLARRLTVIAPDLPGHGFTAQPGAGAFTLPGMAQALQALLEALELRPALAVGHSAGAALLAQMCLEERIAPGVLISFNGALLPFTGVAGQVFSPIAKVLATNPMVPRFFAWRAAVDTGVAPRLLRGTGSRLDEAGIELYARLFRDPEHAGATLRMMANWDLRSLQRALPGLRQRLLLVTGTKDRSIPPSTAYEIHALVPDSEVRRLRGLGHLAHEEKPDELAEIVFEAADALAVAASS